MPLQPHTVEFRPYQPTDRLGVQDLHEVVLRDVEAYDEVTQPAQDVDLADIKTHYLDKGGEFLTGTLGEELVAIGAFRRAREPRQAELRRMRVEPKLQGLGIGGQLLEVLEGSAAQKGYEAMVLETWAHLEATKTFYETRGYFETHTATVGTYEAVFYTKQL